MEYHRSRERVRKILSHQEADRVPYCSFWMRDPLIRNVVDSMNLAPDHRAFCIEGEFDIVCIELKAERAAFAPYLPDLPTEAELSDWGVGSLRQHTSEGYNAGAKIFHPLAEVNSVHELRKYPFPDYAGRHADRGLEKQVQALKQAGFTVLGQMSQTILETAYCLRGIEQLMLDFYDRPEYVEGLFEAIAARRRFQARRFAEAGVDILRIGDDIATQRGLLVSPALYRERIKPFHASVIAAARAVNPGIQVKYHSDGKLTALLPELIDIGVNIINPVQPECMPLLETKRNFGKHLTLWGCIPVQSVWAHGSRADIVKHLRFLMDEIAPGGGFVVRFTNFLATEKSLENLKTFFELFYAMGLYPGSK